MLLVLDRACRRIAAADHSIVVGLGLKVIANLLAVLNGIGFEASRPSHAFELCRGSLDDCLAADCGYTNACVLLMLTCRILMSALDTWQCCFE